MSKWSAHAMCAKCWNGKNPHKPAPVIGENDRSVCCWCGAETYHGIYVRALKPPHCSCAPDK